ncbi:hypothetical protein D3C77_91700 [compost metagenome]
MPGKVVDDVLRVLRIVLPGVRARPHQGHFAHQHIEQLRQFVEAGATDEGPHPGQPRIIFLRLLDHAIFRLMNNHASEFPDTEGFPGPAHALLPEEHRARAVEFDRQGNSQQHR